VRTAGQGVDDLRAFLFSHAVPRQWTFEANSGTSDTSETEIACEIVREKIFRAYYEGKA